MMDKYASNRLTRGEICKYSIAFFEYFRSNGQVPVNNVLYYAGRYGTLEMVDHVCSIFGEPGEYDTIRGAVPAIILW